MVEGVRCKGWKNLKIVLIVADFLMILAGVSSVVQKFMTYAILMLLTEATGGEHISGLKLIIG